LHGLYDVTTGGIALATAPCPEREDIRTGCAPYLIVWRARDGVSSVSGCMGGITAGFNLLTRLRDTVTLQFIACRPDDKADFDAGPASPPVDSCLENVEHNSRVYFAKLACAAKMI